MFTLAGAGQPSATKFCIAGYRIQPNFAYEEMEKNCQCMFSSGLVLRQGVSGLSLAAPFPGRLLGQAFIKNYSGRIVNSILADYFI